MNEAATPLLQVRDLAYSYPARHVFAGWSADFAPGVTWVRGANGSGKSTLLKLLAGALPPLAGRLAVRGVDAAAQPLAYRREVFWCGPGAIAFDHLKPPEYFAFMRSLYPRFDTAAALARASALGLTASCARGCPSVRGALAGCAVDPAAAWIVVSHEALGAAAEARAAVLELSPPSP